MVDNEKRISEWICSLLPIKDFLNAVLAHGRDLQNFHKNNVAKIQKLNKAVLNWHANAEREQKKEQVISFSSIDLAY